VLILPLFCLASCKCTCYQVVIWLIFAYVFTSIEFGTPSVVQMHTSEVWLNKYETEQ